MTAFAQKTIDADAMPAAPALQTHRRTLLRFITCGSVDDGKSTLIGRLLFDSHALADDQLQALRADSVKSGATNGEIDYSLLLDGLAAEREQGITIDVAYRYFSTARRSFIVADTPGHEQYTRNMATGASTTDLAIILVDARKGILEQTRRHSRIVAMLGVRHVVLAINKMDLIGHKQIAFDQIEADYRAFAAGLGFQSLVAIPLSAKNGDNVSAPSALMRWYRGSTLLDVLEGTDVGATTTARRARFVVQWVNRHGSDFRGFSGFVTGGEIAPGDAVTLLPSGRAARITRIVTYDGDLTRAVAGQSVTVTLDREVDVSRGDVIAAAGTPALVAQNFAVRLLWMSLAAHQPDQPLLMKIGAQTVAVRLPVHELEIVDLVSGAAQPDRPLAANTIAKAVVVAEAPVIAEHYRQNRELGGFVLIDKLTLETVALGMVEDALPEDWRENGVQPALGRKNDADLTVAGATVSKAAEPATAAADESHLRSVAKAVTWRATGSIDTFVLAYLFTGEARVAAGISVAEIVTKTVLYYGHERVWARLPFARR